MIFTKKHIRCRASKLHQLQAIIGKMRPVQTEHELIRLGGAADGGYLIPNDLEGVSNCFSPGVDQKSDFELQCAKAGMKVFLADASVDQPVEGHDNFNFTKKYIGGYSRENILSFSEWFNQSTKQEGESILQMDVEGFEYEIFSALPVEIINSLRIIVVEFHGLSRLFERSFYDSVIHIFEKLYQTHIPVHLHPNNYAKAKKKHGVEIPEYLEVTYLRRDRIRNASDLLKLPHPLDEDCCPDKGTMVLQDCWFKK